MAYDFINTILTSASLAGTIRHIGAFTVTGSPFIGQGLGGAAIASGTVGFYTGITATVSGTMRITSSLGDAGRLFFVNGLLVSQSQ